MKKLIGFLTLCCLLCIGGLGQATNPQNTFWNAVNSGGPSLWLNFNDPTSGFLDSISRLQFVGTKNVTTTVTSTLSNGPTCSSPETATSTTLSCSLTTTAGDAIVMYFDQVVTPSKVVSVTDSLGGTPVFVGAGSASQSQLWVLANAAAGSHTLTVTTSTAVTNAFPALLAFDVKGASHTAPVDRFTFNAAATASTSITSGAITTSAANEMLVGHVIQIAGTSSWTAGSPAFSLFPGSYKAQEGGFLVADAAGSYTFNATATVSEPYTASIVAIAPQATTTTTTYNSGTVTPQQPGFDSANPSNTSAEFADNAWSASPTIGLGAIDWSSPWTMMEHIDRLNWNRTGTLVLASKGDIGSPNNNYWELYLQMAGNDAQLCFARNGLGIAIGSRGGQIGTQICTSATYDAMPNGFNYNIAVVNNGNGNSASLSMYINGLAVGSVLPGSASGTSSPFNFGAVALTVAGGAGYASSTAFTSTGGGQNCVVTGSMAATSGVPTSGENGITYTTDSGCTSVPTIVLTSPTGTGVAITAALSGASMNSTTYPLMVPGYVSGGAYFGIAGTTTTQTPTYVDEFAIFPGSLTLGQISNLFYETKFHEMVLNPVATPPVLVFDDDGCVDMDNQFALQLSIALHQYGAVNLAGVVAEDPSTTCEALWRQMLDQAGLNQVPLSVPATFTAGNSGTAEPTANITSYNASTPLSNAAWEPAVTMYRTIFAEYPTTPIDIVSGAGMTAIAEFMQSPADSISSLTGLQLMAQNAANGGAIYALGGGCTASTPPATTPCTGVIGGNLSQDYPSAQYVLSHNGALPIYWIGGNPQNAGPGVLSTRSSNDPMFLVTTSFGTDVRQCFDCLAVEAAVSKYFYGGAQIGFSGGTGYANSTPFTLSGGGPNCQGAGFMTATGGVPNGIEFNWGASAVGSSSGIGSGCTSAPTVNLIGATGTGVTLTAYPELVCGTDTVSETGSTFGDSFTSATCSNHYVSPGSFNAIQTPASGALMEWFINSLVDPPPNGQARAY